MSMLTPKAGGDVSKKTFPIVYSEEYLGYHLGDEHPLNRDRIKKTMEYFSSIGLLDVLEVIEPKRAREEDVLLVHDEELLERVKSERGSLSPDTPLFKGVFNSSLRAVGGTILCAELALKGKVCFNPLGGFHHAGVRTSSGFCYFNDIAIACEKLISEENVSRIAILDVDAHHANGTQEIFYSRRDVLLVSIHQDGRTLYPGTGFTWEIGSGDGRGFNYNFPMPPGSGDEAYSIAMDLAIEIIEKYSPELLIYQGGVDTHYSDILTDLIVTNRGIWEMAHRTRELANRLEIGVAVLFGGGYGLETLPTRFSSLVSGFIGLNCPKDLEIRSDDEVLRRVKGVVEEVRGLFEDSPISKGNI